MKILIPNINETITDKSVRQSWYEFFQNIFRRLLGNFDGSLSLTLHKSTETSGNISSSETSVDSFSIRQEAFREKNTEVIDIFIFGQYASNNNSKTKKVKLNGNIIFSQTNNQNGGCWKVICKIVNLGTSQKIFTFNGDDSCATTSIDTSLDGFDIELTLEGSSTDDLVKEYFEVGFNS